MKPNQSGFAYLAIVLALIIVGAIASTGFYVYRNQSETKESLSSTSSSHDSGTVHQMTVKKESKEVKQQAAPATPAENKNPGYITISEWGIAARIGSTANSDNITYRITKDDYGDDTAYFLLTETVSKNCREIGLALHKKAASGNSKYTKIGNGYYASSAAPMSSCDKFPNEEKAVALLNSLSTSINSYDYEFRASN